MTAKHAKEEADTPAKAKAPHDPRKGPVSGMKDGDQVMGDDNQVHTVHLAPDGVPRYAEGRYQGARCDGR